MTSEERCDEVSEEDDQPAANVNQVHHKPPPDGGWGWVVCLGAWIVNFLTVGQQNAAGVMYSALLNEYSTKRGETGRVAYTFNQTKSVQFSFKTQSSHFVSLYFETIFRQTETEMWINKSSMCAQYNVWWFSSLFWPSSHFNRKSLFLSWIF